MRPKMNSDIAYIGAVDLGKLIAKGKLSSVEVTRTILNRIERLDPLLKSYVSVLEGHALKDARRADKQLKHNMRCGPLHGVPVAVKDLCNMSGLPTTAGIPMFRKSIADHDATVVRKLRKAGAVILGKLHLTEGALAEHHPKISPPINPWSANRWSGASSSGTGVSVAAGLAFGALGSDTGGSIRFPASCNGIVGLKPTWSRVSRFGVFPLSQTLDHVGPLTRSVEDAAAMLQAIAGRDTSDPSSSSIKVPNYLATIGRGVEGVRIGIDRKYAFNGVDVEIKKTIERAIRVLKDAGAIIVPFKMPPLEAALAAWGPICSSDAATAHAASYPTKKRGYSTTFAGFLDIGHAVTGLDYAKAEIIRREFRGNMEEVFTSIDLFIKPVFQRINPTVKAFAAMCESGLDDLIAFTAPDDLTGAPTITLPAGLDKNRSPLSFQLVGRHFEEALLFRAGRVWQSAEDWRDLRPPLAK
ncbi:MAG TPA: Asp-tRNA(Asn)/Glu-tRNA(Gln) amidotransferase GatCAB subunit A [Gammaproteobacteria bacterium]|nr:Asp-tRNA(Asn)/Glu-tRNA(Gln) amidotransferase GatCAB subunit A [Gammaproteobacteria bacterium]